MKSIEKHTTEGGVTLSATLPDKCFAGERIELMISLRNQRKDDVDYYVSIPARDFNIVVHDSKEKPVPLTEFGKQILASPVGGRIFRGVVLVILSPGKDYSITINLTRLYDLTKAGDYSLHLERDVILDEKDNAGKPKRINLKLEVPCKIAEPSK